MPVALTPERHDECCRHEELKQRATEEVESFAAEGKDQMAGLVDRKIEAVEPAVGVRCPETLPAVGRQDQRERGAPASLPDRVVACVLQISSAVCLSADCIGGLGGIRAAMSGTHCLPALPGMPSTYSNNPSPVSTRAPTAKYQPLGVNSSLGAQAPTHQSLHPAEASARSRTATRPRAAAQRRKVKPAALSLLMKVTARRLRRRPTSD